MHFDDRLATVLRLRASGRRAATTQFRQLIDLLGERSAGGDPALETAAYLRLIALGEEIPIAERVTLVAEHGWRFRNPGLVKWFGEEHPHIAAAALARAQLQPEEWAELIPNLPIRARGFLRHRSDLPCEAVRVLDQLGVADRALPRPQPIAEPEERKASARPAPSSAPAQAQTPAPADPDPARFLPGKEEVKALLARIEGFIHERREPDTSAAEEDPAPEPDREQIDYFLFEANSEGRIEWAEEDILPMVFGTDLKKLGSGSTVEAIARRQPIRDTLVALRGAPRIEGKWILDATPRFDPGNGRFLGYIGLLRHFEETATGEVGTGSGEQADRLRQVLHELRTPVNAMQGYAEMIQQQVIGAVPHSYRSIAATIAGDAAHVLAGLEELERLARLESGTFELERGASDFARILKSQIRHLQGVLQPKVARIEAGLGDRPAPIALAESEAERLAWRMLATLAGSVGAGETIAVDLSAQGKRLQLTAEIPAALRKADDIFTIESRSSSGVLSAGIFGIGFSLRLARAEARAAGGDLVCSGSDLILSLPLRVAEQPVSAPENAAS